jgi:hypothetical protein
MHLSPKATCFIIEFLDYRIEAYQERLNVEGLDEDEASDITNDAAFLEALRTDLAQTLEKQINPNIPTARPSMPDVFVRERQDSVSG